MFVNSLSRFSSGQKGVLPDYVVEKLKSPSKIFMHSRMKKSGNNLKKHGCSFSDDVFLLRVKFYLKEHSVTL